MKFFAAVGVVLVFAVGCATVEDRAERNAERIGESVKTYCEDVPKTARDAIRHRVNEEAYPHRAEVECEP